jgi:signal transduction histidine kinase
MSLIKKITGLSRLSPMRMAVLIGSIFLALILLRGAVQLKVTYDQNADRWLGTVSSDLIKLSAYIEQNFDSSFLLVDSVTQLITADAQSLRKGMSGPELHQILKDRMSALQQVDVITVIAEDGEIINSTRSYPPPKINLADRDYFVDALREGEAAGKRSISEPIANRVNGSWTFYISQRLNDRNGQFIGMVVVGLRNSFFSEFFERIRMPSGSSVTLFRDDYIVLSRWPRDDKLLGESFRNGAMPGILRDNPEGTGAIFYEGPRISDERTRSKRIIGVSRLKRYPALLTVTVPEAVYLAEWRVLKWTIIAVTLLGLAVAGFFGWLFIRLLRRREADIARMDLLRQQAEDASKAKSEFLAMVSHELRTPLNGLLGFSELLKDSPLNTEQKGFADMAYASGLQLRDTINDVLDMSKIEAGELTLHESGFSPCSLAAGVVDLYAQNARVKNIALEFESAADVPAYCLGDPLRLRQVLSNLVNNAIKFTETGKVQVVLSGRSSTPGRYVLRLEVFDTGIGIDDTDLKLLFQPFKQVDSSMSRRHGGTGLGLSISKKLVELMHGVIGASSRKDLGSQFWVEIDLAIAESSTQGG